jgi:hypothetical protein
VLAQIWSKALILVLMGPSPARNFAYIPYMRDGMSAYTYIVMTIKLSRVLS